MCINIVLIILLEVKEITRKIVYHFKDCLNMDIQVLENISNLFISHCQINIYFKTLFSIKNIFLLKNK